MVQHAGCKLFRNVDKLETQQLALPGSVSPLSAVGCNPVQHRP